MKIAIYKSTDSLETLKYFGYFDKVIYHKNIGQLKGLKRGESLGIYLFDFTDVDDIIPNLITGFSSVAVFQVNSAEFFKP